MDRSNSVQDDESAEPLSEAGGAGDDPVAAAADPLEEARAEAERWKDLAMRRQADLENFRKRVAREQGEMTRYANERLLEELLPVLDNFQLGLDAARQAKDVQGVVQGMEMVARQLEQFLDGQRVSPVPADPGVAFDPNRHDAVAQEADASVPEGSIVRQVRKGYLLGDRLLRPACVVVSTGGAAAEEGREGN